MLSWLRGRLPERETIGPDECPIIYRWTLWGPDGPSDSARADAPPLKLLLHRFVGSADDRHVHDHPRPFWTLVLTGGYDDLAPCPECVDGQVRAWEPTPFQMTVDERYAPIRYVECSRCGGRGVVLNEVMRAGMLRFRPARHRHRTLAHEGGAYTLVLMGPIRRPWGFWRRGEWWPWRMYERIVGSAFRCEETFETPEQTEERIHELQRIGLIRRNPDTLEWEEATHEA